MTIKEKILTLVKENQNEVLLNEIYEILKESEEDIFLSESQLKRLEIADEQIEKGEVRSNEQVLGKYPDHG